MLNETRKNINHKENTLVHLHVEENKLDTLERDLLVELRKMSEKL